MEYKEFKLGHLKKNHKVFDLCYSSLRQVRINKLTNWLPFPVFLVKKIWTIIFLKREYKITIIKSGDIFYP